MRLEDFRYSHRLRVRWAEVDMQKIVFNAHYLMYLDTAISGYWRAMALPYEDAMHQLGGDLYVKKASVEYHGSARFDEQLDVALKCGRIGRSSMVFTGAIFRGTTLLINAELIYVFADPATQTSKPVPNALRDLLTAFEEGQPMLTIKTGREPELVHDAAPLKGSSSDQSGLAAGDVSGSDAADRLLAVGYNRMGQAVAYGALDGASAEDPQLVAMTVLPMLRGSGLGSALLQTLLNMCAAQGGKQLKVSAPPDAKRFFERQGFRASGDVDDSTTASHVSMVRAL